MNISMTKLMKDAIHYTLSRSLFYQRIICEYSLIDNDFSNENMHVDFGSRLLI